MILVPSVTPNPDWAIAFENTRHVYLVRETKGSLDPDHMRPDEDRKITCAKRQFGAIDVDYAVATSMSDMIGILSEIG